MIVPLTTFPQFFSSYGLSGSFLLSKSFVKLLLTVICMIYQREIVGYCLQIAFIAHCDLSGTSNYFIGMDKTPRSRYQGLQWSRLHLSNRSFIVTTLVKTPLYSLCFNPNVVISVLYTEIFGDTISLIRSGRLRRTL